MPAHGSSFAAAAITIGVAAGVAGLLAGCAATSATGSAEPLAVDRPASSAGGPTSTGPVPSSASPSPSPSPSETVARGSSATAPPAGFAWHASPGSPSVEVAALAGGAASLMWMDPAHLRFRFVPGYAVPEGSPSTAADRTPSTWVPRMVAGFDSGYKLSDHVGGYYYLGRTVAPLRNGLASLVVHSDGSLAVGVWGKDVGMTPDTVVVRQNLRPLIVAGVSQASARDTPRTWGISNGNRPLANRSALGRLPDGSFVFEYAHDVTAQTLAATLVKAGVTEAIMLDMNISWPTGFVYSHNGSRVTGSRINAHTVRAPSIYLTRFKKDFIAVESA